MYRTMHGVCSLGSAASRLLRPRSHHEVIPIIPVSGLHVLPWRTRGAASSGWHLAQAQSVPCCFATGTYV